MFLMRLLKRFLINGMIMSATSLLLRALGVGFNAFVSRRLGADGMGLFTLIMSVLDCLLRLLLRVSILPQPVCALKSLVKKA